MIRAWMRPSAGLWLLVLVVVLAGCSRVGAFDLVAPREPGVRLAGDDIAYGEGPRRRLSVHVPAERTGSAPVLFFIQGGGWKSGDRRDYDFVANAFAARGHVVVIADYRLVPQVRYPAFVEDNAAALAWIRANIALYGGDPGQIHLAGHSAGAYNAIMLALQPAFLRPHGLSPADIRAVVGISGPYDFLPLDDPATIAAFKGYQPLAATQPVNHARADAPPVLLLHGSADTRVKPRNAEALAAALRRAGADVELRLYEGLGHAGPLLALSLPFRGKAPVLADMLAFFAEHGAAPASGMGEEGN